MKWMILISRIIVIAGFVKGGSTVSKFVDMHAEETGEIRTIIVREVKDFYLHQNSSHIVVVKGGKTFHRACHVSSYVCNGRRVR